MRLQQLKVPPRTWRIASSEMSSEDSPVLWMSHPSQTYAVRSASPMLEEPVLKLSNSSRHHPREQYECKSSSAPVSECLHLGATDTSDEHNDA
mmetsp:Transcript_51746/g.106976  ORF Transcript_51746/g.106976 Transcript_51746/m.106976 type:complete len:93 (+) Transcript_51746:494-772(+)